MENYETKISCLKNIEIEKDALVDKVQELNCKIIKNGDFISQGLEKIKLLEKEVSLCKKNYGDAIEKVLSWKKHYKDLRKAVSQNRNEESETSNFYDYSNIYFNRLCHNMQFN